MRGIRLWFAKLEYIYKGGIIAVRMRCVFVKVEFYAQTFRSAGGDECFYQGAVCSEARSDFTSRELSRLFVDYNTDYVDAVSWKIQCFIIFVIHAMVDKRKTTLWLFSSRLYYISANV